MYRARASRQCDRCGARRAFTLVELITAASLMTVMMMGVVQIFAVITRTAAEAEGMHFVHQQMRAVFDRLHTDLRGMTREGYLQIKSSTITSNGPTWSGSSYHDDTLAFVTVGPCVTQWHQSANEAYEGSAAEVVYTSNVKTPTNVLKVERGSLPPKTLDPRRGILARGQWILTGEKNGTADDKADRPDGAVPWLADMFINQNPGTTVTSYKDRINGGATPRPHLVVWPWTTLTGDSEFPKSLKRVMASCVSDFYVESFDPKALLDISLFKSIAADYRWSTYFSGTRVLKSWPRAIRVTIAAHDPGDTLPPKTGEYLRGYAMQEIFWISDP